MYKYLCLNIIMSYTFKGLIKKLRLGIRISEDIVRTQKNIKKLESRIEAKHIQGLIDVQKQRELQLSHHIKEIFDHWKHINP